MGKAPMHYSQRRTSAKVSGNAAKPTTKSDYESEINFPVPVQVFMLSARWCKKTSPVNDAGLGCY